MGTMATLHGNWRHVAGKRRIHLYRAGAPVCGARVREVGTVKVAPGNGLLKNICYDCLAYGASGR